MSRHQASHIAAVARDFAAYLVSLGFDERDILKGTGLVLSEIEEDGAQAPLPAIVALFNRGVALTGNDLIGLDWGKQRSANRLGLIGYMGRTSPTLGQLLANLARFRRVFSEPMEIDVARLAQDGVYSWTYKVPAHVDCTQFVESQAAYMLVGFTRAVQKQIRPTALAFEHQRDDHQDTFRRFFGCPVQFHAPRNQITFDLADLALPIVTSDEGLNKILVQHCEMVLAQTPPDSSDIRVIVERAIADRLSSGDLSQDIIARDLGMSARTLARRLDQTGVSYQKVLANLRQALAERYLRSAQMSQSEIAYLLGYSDVSSFATAFKRWTGRSPGEIRHSLA
ncbi:AraC family transcriptional regulator [Shimia sp.]|uniref:AraC family transcriptional regulator n=1 Tax=Shimia sp. TaxID=1954381 RepID=UPI0032987069